MAIGAIWDEIWDEDIWDNTIWEASAPTISSAQAVNVEPTETDILFFTNKVSGTAYLVITESATQPSIAQIKAGNDHTGAAAVASDTTVPGASAVFFRDVGTLTEGATYYGHIVQTDAAANDSNRISTPAFVAQAGLAMVRSMVRGMVRPLPRSLEG